MHTSSYLQRCITINEEVLQALVCNADADPTDLFTTDLNFHLAGMVDENTVTSVRNIEWDAFVRLLAGSASVSIPYAYRLSYDAIIGIRYMPRNRKRRDLPFFTKAPNCSPRP